MVIYFDTEFTGLHKDTTLISIGMVDRRNERTFYWEFTDYDKSQINSWLQDNVIAHTAYLGENKFDKASEGDIVYNCGTKEECKEELIKWLSYYNEKIYLITDVGHYDMVLLIDIFGTAFDLPDFIVPTYIDINVDISTVRGVCINGAFDYSREKLLEEFNIQVEGEKHNALYDAKVIRALSIAMEETYF